MQCVRGANIRGAGILPAKFVLSQPREKRGQDARATRHVVVR
jgi:hypothetical protein